MLLAQLCHPEVDQKPILVNLSLSPILWKSLLLRRRLLLHLLRRRSSRLPSRRGLHLLLHMLLLLHLLYTADTPLLRRWSRLRKRSGRRCCHSSLARCVDWRYFQKEDGSWWARETNTMPQWAGSCWYYQRFADPANNDAFVG